MNGYSNKVSENVQKEWITLNMLDHVLNWKTKSDPPQLSVVGRSSWSSIASEKVGEEWFGTSNRLVSKNLWGKVLRVRLIYYERKKFFGLATCGLEHPTVCLFPYHIQSLSILLG